MDLIVVKSKNQKFLQGFPTSKRWKELCEEKYCPLFNVKTRSIFTWTPNNSSPPPRCPLTQPVCLPANREKKTCFARTILTQQYQAWQIKKAVKSFLSNSFQDHNLTNPDTLPPHLGCWEMPGSFKCCLKEEWLVLSSEINPSQLSTLC